ncbi:toll/interleukin-1 receptor domain-containing protein [Streptomyces sp. NPDC001373]|uniref:toll/interleukin-1 receptor domain-containing protein n=1 Tax=Streptomyces sp. NPDC001373 TaxID=3364565 RepID=UPI00367A1D02
MYDAFISYSQQRDEPLADGLQEGLEKLLRKGWRRRRTLKVFRDCTSLAASSDLPGSIRAALDNSRYLVLVGSPEAAASPWVRQELALWRAGRSMDHLLLAYTAGEIVWDRTRRDFDWARTTAIPRELSGAFTAEPLWVDLRPFRDSADLSYAPGHPFRDKVVTLAAPIHNVPKDVLDSRGRQEDRNAGRRLRAAVAAFVVLLLGLGTTWTVAWRKSGEASARARTAASRSLAARALEVAPSDPRKAAQFALYAYAVEPTGQAAQALGRAIAANDSTAQHLQRGNESVARFQGAGHSPATKVAMSRDGAVLAYYSGLDPDVMSDSKYAVHLYDIRSRTRLPDLVGKAWPQDGGGFAFSWDGRMLAVETPFNEIELWDVSQRKLLRRITAGNGQQLAGGYMNLRSFAFSGDGTRVAAAFFTPTGESSAVYRLAVWDTATGRQILEEGAVEDGVKLAFDGAHRLVALDSSVGTVRFLMPGSGTWSAPRTLGGYPRLDRDARFGVTLSPDGARVSVTTSGGMHTDVWDVGSGRRLTPTEAATAEERPGFTADGQSVVVQDAANRRRVLGSFTYPVVSLAGSGDGTRVVAASNDGAISLFSATSFQAGTTLANEQRITSNELTPDRRLAVRPTAEGSELWSVDGDGVKPIGRIGWIGQRGADGRGRLISSSDRARVVTVDEDGSLSLWNPRDGRRTGAPWRPQRRTEPVAFLADHVRFLGITDHTLQVIDPRTWQVVQSLPLGTGPDASRATSVDGTTVALVDRDELKVWRWMEGKGLQQVYRGEIPGGSDFRMSVALSRHGEKAVVINGDHRLVVFDLTSGHVVQGAAVAPEGQSGVAFSTDNTLLVHAYGTGSDSGLQFWDASTGEARGSWAMTGHGEGSVTTFNGTDGSVLTMGADGSLVRRTVDLAAWRTTLCSLAPEPLPPSEYDRYLKGMEVTPPCRAATARP